MIRQICREQLNFVSLYDQSYQNSETDLELHIIADEVKVQAKVFLEESDRMSRLYHIGKKDFDMVYSELVEEFIVVYRSEESALLDAEENIVSDKDLKKSLHSAVKSLMRAQVISEQARLDGRSPAQVRPILTEVGYLPRTHGSAIFERGMTQILSVATLGGPSDAMTIDDMFEEEEKRYIHHYNFPPYATGETKPLRGTGRREVGHGRLAEKALQAVLPTEAEFPYIIRVVSETLTCNGSSSM